MPQLLVRPDQRNGNRFRVAGDEAHHLVRVLRAHPGQEIDIFDGKGARFRARVTSVDPAVPAAEGDILSELPAESSAWRFRLIQGLPKGPKFDFVIEKAAELGATEIVPFLSEKSPIRLDADAGEGKRSRWARLAEAAATQCGRADIPTVAAPVPFDGVVRLAAESPTFLLSTSPSAQPVAEWVQDRAARGSFFDGDSVIINLVVGPESGLATAEETLLVRAGAWPVSLGRNVLRTETAGLAALAVFDYALNRASQQK